MSETTRSQSEQFADTASQPETRGIELVAESERHGKARSLFPVWAATMVSVLLSLIHI